MAIVSDRKALYQKRLEDLQVGIHRLVTVWSLSINWWLCGHYPSCEFIALRENFVDRPKSYDSFSAKSRIFLTHEKMCTVWGMFLNSHTQPDPKQSIKKFLRHLTTALLSLLTLQISDIFQSSLKSPTLEFSLIICHIRDLDVWSRGKGKSAL
jgi:hypothetical protein